MVPFDPHQPLIAPIIQGLKERPLKGPLGLDRGCMRLYKRYIRVT